MDIPGLCKVDNSNIEEILKGKINSQWPVVKNSENFPGPQPISLELKDTHKLLRYDYYVCEKTDGLRYMLYGTNIYNTNRVFLIDRSFRFYQVDGLVFDDNFYNESIVDGEMIETTNGLRYYCHDCICLAGVNVAKSPLDIRIEFISRCVKDLYKSTTNFSIHIKPFWNFKDFDKYLENHYSITDHKVDGIILTPVKLPVCTGTQMSMFKWKDKHTFDFAVSWKITTQRRIKYDLYVSDKSKHVKFESINSRTPKGGKFDKLFKNIFCNGGDLNECNKKVILECSYIDDNYIPILIRYDKLYPNSIHTVNKTHLNILEDIKLEFLLKLSQENNIV